MTEFRRTRARSALIAALALTLCLALAACGGKTASTATSTTTASAQNNTTTTAGQPARLRACLRHAGLQVPESTSSIAELLAHLPKGINRAQLLSAVKECAGLSGGIATKARTSGAAYKQAFVNFVSCMRQHGANLPAPNTSGKGPIIDTKGIDTTSATYKSAASACSPILRKVLSLPTIPGAKK